MVTIQDPTKILLVFAIGLPGAVLPLRSFGVLPVFREGQASGLAAPHRALGTAEAKQRNFWALLMLCCRGGEPQLMLAGVMQCAASTEQQAA